MSTVATTDSQHICRYCERSFRRPESLAVHLCEVKKRYQSEREPGVQIGLQAYLRFYETTQGSARLKTYDDFAKSPYYRAFVKFGRYCVAIRAINVPRLIDWLLKHNKKLDHWSKDSLYGEYLADHLRNENVNDALSRAIEHSMTWSEETGNPERDFLRFGNDNSICHAVTVGRISAWVLYHCESGTGFLARLNPEQVAMIWPFIDADFWAKKFRDYPADAEYARELLTQAGW